MKKLFVGYARKSTDTEDKQVQSIDDQVAYIKKIAKEENLLILNIFIESVSARKPDKRKEFLKMISHI